MVKRSLNENSIKFVSIYDPYSTFYYIFMRQGAFIP